MKSNKIINIFHVIQKAQMKWVQKIEKIKKKEKILLK